MSFSRLLLLGAAAASIAACGSSSDTTLVTPDPAALVRFVNAVPDTGFMDFRFTDAVEGVPSTPFVNLPFRGGFDRAYQRVNVGPHHIRVFMGSANTIRIKNPATPLLPLDSVDITNVPSIVSTVMGDTTFTFALGVHYTFVFYGSARAGAQKFVILTDNIAAAPSGNFSLRAANLNTTAQDVYVNSSTTILPAVGGTPGYPNVAPLTATSYINIPLAVAGSNYAVSAADVGTTTPARSTLMPVGTAAVAEVPGVSAALSPTAGSRVGGVFTAYIFPASTTGSKAASFATPGVVLQADKQP
jgi:hypothetical protein